MSKSKIYLEAAAATGELIEKAGLKKGQVLVVGCSTSEVMGRSIGSFSSPETAEELFSGIFDTLNSKGIYLAAQCCEHLNRAIIAEREAFPFAEEVNAVPQPKAGGSFASAAYESFDDAVALETVKAAAGIDIGGTLIGMHLKAVAVPVRTSVKTVGRANVICARTRPKYIGGPRAVYED